MASLPFPRLPVLMVDDEPRALTSYELTLHYGGVTNTISCQDARLAPGLIQEHRPGLMLLDLLMPNQSGEELLRQVSAEFPDTLVVVVTGVDDVDTAVRCMKSGAFDYLVKPVTSERLLTTVRRALDFHELKRENRSLKKRLLSPQLENPDAFQSMITRHPKMRAMFRYMEAIAPSPKPVLITGETGVGKELAAKALHDLSGRPGPFLAANVAGLDDSVFSDTLFGHVKGAFTGADRPRQGLLAHIGEGTLLLDEVGDLSPQSQVKLLRLLDYGEYFPLGSDSPHQSKGRVIASTNRDLGRLQKTGAFRKDLYFRLLTHHLEVPPLRERKEDLPLLLDYFLTRASAALGKKKPTTPPELPSLLAAYDFPGNIRELESMIFDAVSGHAGRIMSMESFKQRILDQAQALPLEGGPGSDPGGPALVFSGRLPGLKEAGRLLVEEAMKRANHNVAIAAGLLGISHQALRKRLKNDPAGS